MCNDEKYLLKIDCDSPGMNPHCYSMSGEYVSIPPEFTVEVDKCVFSQAEEIFTNNRNISSFVFPANIYNNVVQVSYVDTYLEFVKWGNGEQIYAVFTEQDRGIKYRVDILGVVIEATSQEIASTPDIDDENNIPLFVDVLFQKCLSINKDHLQTSVYNQIVAQVDQFNLYYSLKSYITLFNVATAYANSHSNGLGVLLEGTPWTTENLKRTFNKSAEDVRASLDKLDLPDDFIHIIWKAGYADADVVIFEHDGITFEQLPIYKNS